MLDKRQVSQVKNKLALLNENSHRGVWAKADFQLYVAKPDPTAGDMSDWAFIGYKCARSLRPLRSAGRRDDVLTTIQIFAPDDNSLLRAYEMKDTLKRLIAHKCGFTVIPEMLPHNLHNLERLDLSCNKLTEESFPPTLKYLTILVELNVNSNVIESLPESIFGLPRLQRLYLGFNFLTSLSSIEKLKTLTCLDLECNQITEFPWQEVTASLRKLEILNLQSNQLAYIDKSVKFFRELVMLNVSHNCLKALPAELFNMRSLRNLDASHNEIIRLPAVSLGQQSTDMLDLLDLSHNKIFKYADWLLFVAWTIDLTENSISQLPGSVIKHMNHETEQVVLLRNNPMVFPPQDVCLAGLPSIIKFFQEIKVNANLYQGLKVMVIGSEGSGKTSLVQSIADGTSRLALEDEATKMCSITLVDVLQNHHGIYITGIEKNFKMAVWDFSGDPFYLNAVHHFLDSNALYIHVFNLATYKAENFEKDFAQWLDYVVAKNNQIKLILVATHSDLVSEERAKRICDEAGTMVQTHFHTFKERISKKIEAIESMENIGAYMQDQLKHYVNVLLTVSVHLYSKPIIVSNSTFTAIDKVLVAIKAMASTTKLFPLVMRQIPSLWIAVHDTIEDLAKNTRVPIMHIEEFKEELIYRHGMKSMMTEICHYLHDTSNIIWLHNDEKLKDFVFLRPKWLLDVIKAIIRPDIKLLDFEELEDLLLPRGIIRSRFVSMRREADEHGCLDNDFLKVLLAREAPSTSPKFGLLVQILCSVFEYAFPVERERNQSSQGAPFKLNTRFQFLTYKPALAKRPQSATQQGPTITIDSATEVLSKTNKLTGPLRLDSQEASSMNMEHKFLDGVPCILIPCLRHNQEPSSIQEIFSQLHTQQLYHLTAIFAFPVYLPPGLLSRFYVRLTQPQFDLELLSHWGTGIYARHKRQAVIFYIRAWQERVENGSDGASKTYVRVEACNEKEIEFKSVQDTWAVFHPLIQDMEQVIGKYQGLRCERFVECPSCLALTFSGEWLAPKDMQNILTVVCKSCKREVQTELLVQPKERKAVEQLWKVIIELNRRREMRTEFGRAKHSEMKMKRILSAFATRPYTVMTSNSVPIQEEF